TSLWFCEGTTSYYDLIIPLRAGIYDSKTFLECLSKDITRLQTTPGRLIQNLSESSFDTWIKLYRRDSNSDNSQVSYYLKGELVSLLLDLLIRKCHHNQRSLDDVMRLMWQKFGAWEIGFTPQNLRDAIESVADMDLGYFFDNYVDGTIELPFDEYLEPFGLKLIGVHDEDAPPYLGAIAKSEHGQEIVKFVEANSPARIAGIDPGDQLLAINGWRVTAEQLCDRLKDYQVNDTIEITLFHEDELRTLPVTLGKSPPTRYQILPIDNPTDEQKHNLTGWLG
ncbi:MAG TPA: peptidase M61, partial [Cyanobacteria bacterium UBA11166]|nr:peptidase M61 [Cyanobacteria bacterium UBA11166]